MKRSNALAKETITLLDQILPRTARLRESVILQVQEHYKGQLDESHLYLIEDGLFRAFGLPTEPGYEGS